MLMIRFQRIGRRNDPAFRIVVLEHQSGPKAGKYVDLVGSYNPKTKISNIDGAKIEEWVKKGAQVSPSVHNLLVKTGLRDGAKIPAVTKKNLEKHISKRKAEEEAAAAKAAEAEAKALADAKAAEAKAAEEAAAAAPVEETAPVEAPEVPAPTEETPTVEEAVVEETPAEEPAPVEEAVVEAAA